MLGAAAARAAACAAARADLRRFGTGRASLTPGALGLSPRTDPAVAAELVAKEYVKDPREPLADFAELRFRPPPLLNPLESGEGGPGGAGAEGGGCARAGSAGAADWGPALPPSSPTRYFSRAHPPSPLSPRHLYRFEEVPVGFFGRLFGKAFPESLSRDLALMPKERRAMRMAAGGGAGGGAAGGVGADASGAAAAADAAAAAGDVAALLLRHPSLQLAQLLDFLRERRAYPSGEFAIDRRGILLDGPRGAGKSYTLAHLAWHAERTGWLTVVGPCPHRCATHVTEIQRTAAGTYLQPELASEWLARLLLTTERRLARLPVTPTAYGRFAIDGTLIARLMRGPDMRHLMRRAAAGDARRGAARALRAPVSHAHLAALLRAATPAAAAARRAALAADRTLARDVRVPSLRSEILPRPATVADIARAGLDAENGRWATAAIAEVLEQLRLQNRFPVLLVLDNWNESFHVSKFLSIRYENAKSGGYIPTHHLALPRLFSTWGGGSFRRGLVLAGCSWQRLPRRQFDCRHLGVDPSEICYVENFSPLEAERVVQHAVTTGAALSVPRAKVPEIFASTGEARAALAD